jgi:hypothetical protein
VNAVGALQLLSDVDALKSVREPLLKARTRIVSDFQHVA